MVSTLDEKMLSLNEAILRCLEEQEESKKRTKGRKGMLAAEKAHEI